MTWRAAGLDRLSPEDARILKLERGVIRGHVCKVVVLEPAPRFGLPTVESLRLQIGARLDAAPRLRQRILATPLHVAGPVWADDASFDIARHVTALSAAGPVDDAELQKLAAARMSQRLDHSRPLWHLDVVEKLEDGAMALIWRLHHSLADGTTSMRIGSALLWDEDPEWVAPAASSWLPVPEPGRAALIAGGVVDRARRRRRVRIVERDTRLSLAAIKGLWSRELVGHAAVGPLAHRAGGRRAVAFASAPLEDCHRAGKALGDSVTLNDVALSLLAGGVGAWLERIHGPTEGVRVKVPVSLHHSDAGAALANHDSYFFVDLPVGERDPVKRLLTINRETTERKLAHDAETLYRLGVHPFFAHWAMSPRVFTFNVSNVPGPSTEVYVQGARVRELYSIAEIAPRHALRAAVISAAGMLFFGLCADAEAVPELGVMAAGIRDAVQELLAASPS